MKFPTPSDVGQVWGDQKKARVCYVSSTKSQKIKEVAIDTKTLSTSEQASTKPQLIEALKAIRLHEDNKDKLVYVGSQLFPHERQAIM